MITVFDANAVTLSLVDVKGTIGDESAIASLTATVADSVIAFGGSYPFGATAKVAIRLPVGINEWTGVTIKAPEILGSSEYLTHENFQSYVRQDNVLVLPLSLKEEHKTTPVEVAVKWGEIYTEQVFSIKAEDALVFETPAPALKGDLLSSSALGLALDVSQNEVDNYTIGKAGDAIPYIGLSEILLHPEWKLKNPGYYYAVQVKAPADFVPAQTKFTFQDGKTAMWTEMNVIDGNTALLFVSAQDLTSENIYSIAWSEGTDIQTIRFALAQGITHAPAAAPAKLGAIERDETSGGSLSANSATEGTTTTLTLGAAGETIAQNDEGLHQVAVLVKPSTELADTSQASVTITKNLAEGEGTPTVVEQKLFDELKGESGNLLYTLNFESKSDQWLIEVQWAVGEAAQIFSIVLDPQVELAQPTATETTVSMVGSAAESSGTALSTNDKNAIVTASGGLIAKAGDIVATKVFERTAKGIKFGSSSAAGSLKLTLTRNVKAVKVTVASYNDKESYLTVNSVKSVKLTTTPVEITFEFDPSTLLTLTSVSRIWVSQIVFVE